MSDQYPSNVELHRWAEAQPWGHKVASRRISNDLIKAWNRAHPDRPYVKSQAYHVTVSGLGSFDCNCRRCLDACSAYQAGRRESIADGSWS